MRVLPSLILAALATPAVAGQTEWQEVFPGVRLRMIADDVRQPDGTTLVGLEIDMPRTTKTYWRVPGETGIPTLFDLSASHGISGEKVLWPYPVVDQTAGYLDYVYYGPTVLPLSVEASGKSSEIAATVSLGICSDVCVPASASFSLPLSFDKADAAQQIRLQQAVALAPLPWDGPEGAVGEVRTDDSGNLVVSVGGDIDPASLIADVDVPGVMLGAPQKSREGVVTLPLLGGGTNSGLEGRPVHFTFLTPAGAYETTRVIGPPEGTSP